MPLSKEQVKKITEIYDDAISKLEALGKERKGVIQSYIKELETQKINAIRESLLASYKK